MVADVTARNLDFLRGIAAAQNETGFFPTVRELGDRLGVSASSTTHDHLRRLERAGLVERNGQRLRITVRGQDVLGQRASRAPDGGAAA